MSDKNPLAPLFSPRSIAVIGASEAPGKAAERRTRSLIEGGFQGQIFLVNPKRDTLFNRPVQHSVKDIPAPLDLAMVVIQARFIPQAVEDAASLGAKGVIIITAGMGETGPEGKKIEARIMETARANNIQIVGPNCSGMYSASAKMNLLGIPEIAPGRLSVLAQSGNVIDSLTHYARRRNRGFSKIISSGNAIGVRFHDYLRFLGEDPATGAIMLYLESIRFGDQMIAAAREVSRVKPIIALKVGRTTAGARASASHTGALAANDAIVEAAFKQAGIHRVSNVDEMFDLAETLLDSPLPRGNRVTILSEGGGDNSVAADNAERWGLAVPVLPEKRQEKIKKYLLAGMPAHNPIDYGGTAEENPDMIRECVREVMEDDSIDSVYLTGFFGGFREIIAPHVGALEAKASADLAELVRTHAKPLVVHTSFAEEDFEAINILKKNGIRVTSSSDRAAQALGVLSAQAQNIRRLKADRTVDGAELKPDLIPEIFRKVRQAGRSNLLETESRDLLAAYGLPLPQAHLAQNPDHAAELAAGFKVPLACKVVSPDIIHKSDAGGVCLNVTDPEEVRAGCARILENVKNYNPKSRIEGVLLSPMAAPGQEIIVGLIRDPSFGPVIMFGLGGIFVEILGDVSFGVAPLSLDDVERMVTGIKSYKALSGVRGGRAKDVEAVKDLIARVSLIALDNPGVAEIDLNPVIIHEKGLSIVDSRIILQDETKA